MQTSSIPTKIPTPFANSGTKNTIPIPSQIGITGGAASFTDGFPPLTRTAISAGGIPPFGADFNGIFNAITQAIRWVNSGSGYPFDSDFSTEVTGYPKGALIPTSDFSGYWLNTSEANTTTPENSTSVATGWVPGVHYGVTALTGLSSSSVTLTTLQAAKTRITLAGALTSNINLIFPAWTRGWTIVNACTGNFSVTCKTISGTGIVVVNGATANITCDGTNIVLDSNVMNITTQVTGTVGQSLNSKMSVTAASATATFTSDELIVGTALGGSQYRIGSFSKTINLATTGAGGMDTGTVPASGYVALYAIYNPTTATSALLAVNATAAVAPSVYGGANMPAGYTASALVSVWRTASSQFVIGYQQDRKIDIARANAFVGSSNNSSQVALSLSGYVPSNAKMIYGDIYYNSTSSSDSLLFSLAPTSGIVGQLFFRGVPNANQAMYKINIQIAQSVYYSNTGASSSPILAISLSGYEI